MDTRHNYDTELGNIVSWWNYSLRTWVAFDCESEKVYEYTRIGLYGNWGWYEVTAPEAALDILASAGNYQ